VLKFKKKNRDSKFRFVRFSKEEEAKKEIWRLDGSKINGNPVRVTRARFPFFIAQEKKTMPHTMSVQGKRKSVVSSNYRPVGPRLPV
jgi:RNA recognition motif-containing protein